MLFSSSKWLRIYGCSKKKYLVHCGEYININSAIINLFPYMSQGNIFTKVYT